jgi:alkylation response protein AidB-like acyl-CoA dehydrogenase
VSAAPQVETTHFEVTDHPVYQDFAEVVRTVIAPRAVEVDATEVPLSNVAALREVGYFSWAVPVQYGGTAVPPEVKYAASELLFGACPSTALAVTQHDGPVGLALKSKSKAALALLPQLATGERIGTTGVSQIRTWREGRSMFAKKVPGGYRFDGPVTYLSGFGIADTGNLGAVDPDNDTYVFGIVDLTQPGVSGKILELAAVRGSRTASLQLDNVFVADEFVGEVVDIDEWLASDGITKQNPFAAVGPIGIGRAALADALEVFPGEPSLLKLSEELEHAAITPLRDPYWRAQLDEIVVRATLAGLVARGGRGLNTNHIAQVRARAAFFLQVRGLSAPMRVARFEKLAHIDNPAATQRG